MMRSVTLSMALSMTLSMTLSVGDLVDDLVKDLNDEDAIHLNDGFGDIKDMVNDKVQQENDNH